MEDYPRVLRPSWHKLTRHSLRGPRAGRRRPPLVATLRAKHCTLHFRTGVGRTAHGPCDWPPGLPVFGFSANHCRPPGYALRFSRSYRPSHLGAPLFFPSNWFFRIASLLPVLQSSPASRPAPPSTSHPAGPPQGPRASANSPASTPQRFVSGVACLLCAHQSLLSPALIGHCATNRSAPWTPPAARSGSARGGAAAAGGGGGGGGGDGDASQPVSERGGRGAAQA